MSLNTQEISLRIKNKLDKYRQKRGHVMEGRRHGDMIWGTKQSLVLQRGGCPNQGAGEKGREIAGHRALHKEKTLPQNY